VRKGTYSTDSLESHGGTRVIVKANTLCLLGIIAGFVAMVSVWRFVYFASPYDFYDFPYARFETGISLFKDSLEHLWYLDVSTFYIGALFATLGVMIGIATPLGGVLEITGACLFLSVTPSEEFVGWLHGYYYYLRIGPYIALLSGSLMILSMALPVVLNRGLPPGEGWRFLWTFAIDPKDGRGARGHMRSFRVDLASRIPLRPGRARQALVAVVVAVVAASVALSLNDSYSKESTKIAIYVTTETSDVATFSIGVDDRISSIYGGGVLHNYYVEAGEHSIFLEVTSPTQNESRFSVYVLPLQTMVITVLITDTSWTISET
jgi:hypothetical protein